MTVIDMYHLKCEVIKQLSELTLEQIEEVRGAFQQSHPEEYLFYSDLFDLAEHRKHDEINMKEIIALVEEKKNAPSGAATPTQGNVTVNQPQKTGTPAL